jgi:hypothetical protein
MVGGRATMTEQTLQMGVVYRTVSKEGISLAGNNYMKINFLSWIGRFLPIPNE